MEKKHTQYMDQALLQAQKAFDVGEVPIGAVVVDAHGVCIGVGYNTVETHNTQTAHAEMRALQEAARYLGNWRLIGCVLYVTLEPCSMCYAAAKLSRLDGIYYAAPSPLFGFHLDKNSFLPLYNSDLLFVRGGIREEKSRKLLKQFFEKKRSKGG